MFASSEFFLIKLTKFQWSAEDPQRKLTENEKKNATISTLNQKPCIYKLQQSLYFV